MKNEKKRFDEDYICFTTDIDWAPECAIAELFDFFERKNIDLTVFATHDSQEVNRRVKAENIGIHPNFIQPSSQGTNIKEVLDYCQSIVPNADFFRCHKWYASNDIYDELMRRGFAYESNLCTNMDILSPFVHRSGMYSFPVFFEDGAYIQHGLELQYSLIVDRFRQNGLKVVNIHPMHFALNTPYFKYTRDIKDRLSREQWNKMTLNELEELSYKNYGIRSMIKDIVSDAIDRGANIVTLRQAYGLL